MVLVRIVHGAGMKRGDLVVVEVRSNERLRGELAGYLLYEIGGQAEPAQAVQVGTAIVADSRHDERIFPEELQVIGDVAGRAPELASHLRREEADVEDVQLVGEQVVTEAVRKHHDGVVGDGAVDEQCHSG